MKNLLIGDVHGDIFNLEKVFKKAVSEDCKNIIQLGDFGFGFPSYTLFHSQIEQLIERYKIPLYFLKGNHDNHEILNKYTSITELSKDYYFIPNGVEFSFDGVSFIAYGGAYSIDKKFRTEGVDFWRDEEISISDVYNSKGKVADIMLTHDTPYTSNIMDYMVLLPIEEAMENRKKLQAIVEEIKPKKIFHGHYHSRINCSANYTEGEIVTWFPCIGLAANVNKLEQQCYVFDTVLFKQEKL